MTPEEKSEELIEKFRNKIMEGLVFPDDMDERREQAWRNRAIQCAVICVEEIVKAVTPEWMERADETLSYWQSVLSHLKSLQ